MIELDDTEARKTLTRQARELSDKAIRRAETRGLNRALRGARTELSREVRKEYRLKSRTISDAVGLERASASDRIPTATLTVTQKPIPLVQYGSPRQVRKGVSVTIRKGQRQTVQSAFIVDSRGAQAYLREGKSRLPIRRLYGPSVRQLAPEAIERSAPRVNQRVSTEIERAVQREIDKAFKDA